MNKNEPSSSSTSSTFSSSSAFFVLLVHSVRVFYTIYPMHHILLLFFIAKFEALCKIMVTVIIIIIIGNKLRRSVRSQRSFTVSIPYISPMPSFGAS